MASSCLSTFFRVDLRNPSREQERAHFLTFSLSKKCDWGGHVLYPPPPLYQHSVHVCNGVAAASSPRMPCEKRKWKNSFYGWTLNCDCQCPRSQKKRLPCHFSWKECFFFFSKQPASCMGKRKVVNFAIWGCCPNPVDAMHSTPHGERSTLRTPNLTQWHSASSRQLPKRWS